MTSMVDLLSFICGYRGRYSKYLTHISLGHSQSEQSPEQGPGSPLLGQMLTLRLLDSRDSRNVDIKEAGAVSEGRLGVMGVATYQPAEKYSHVLMTRYPSVYWLNSSLVLLSLIHHDIDS